MRVSKWAKLQYRSGPIQSSEIRSGPWRSLGPLYQLRVRGLRATGPHRHQLGRYAQRPLPGLDLEGLKAVHERCAKYKVVVHDLLTSARPTDLVKAVEEFRYKFGHHPDVIIVDYLN